MTRNLTSLTAEQAAARLGVKVATVYAYVSRGLLPRTLSEDGRTSRFDPGDVDELARRGRPRRTSGRSGTIDVVLATDITAITEDHLRYRGHEVGELVDSATFEQVAELLWRGELATAPPWSAPPGGQRVAARAAAVVPATASITDRLALVCAAVAATEPLRIDLRAPAVTANARSLLRLFVAALPPVTTGAPPSPWPGRRAFAGDLWPRLSPKPATRPRVRVLDTALMLLADHELATSTFAARVAASTRADPYSVVLAALGTVSGPLHGKAAVAAHEMLDDAAASDAPDGAVARALGRHGRVPGFGHPVYRGVDPRAALLLDAVGPLLPRRTVTMIDRVRAAVARTTDDQPNIDFALAVLGHASAMPVGHTEAVFAIARTAGWIAHALEEYGEAPLRYRARALYTGR